jgi:hypothetical protein
MVRVVPEANLRVDRIPAIDESIPVSTSLRQAELG